MQIYGASEKQTDIALTADARLPLYLIEVDNDLTDALAIVYVVA